MMSKSKYVDIASIVQVIGNIYNNPNLLDMDEKYFFVETGLPYLIKTAKKLSVTEEFEEAY